MHTSSCQVFVADFVLLCWCLRSLRFCVGVCFVTVDACVRSVGIVISMR